MKNQFLFLLSFRIVLSIHNHAVTFKMFQTFIFIKMNNQNIIQQSSSVYLNNPNWQDLIFIQNEFITSY